MWEEEEEQLSFWFKIGGEIFGWAGQKDENKFRPWVRFGAATLHHKLKKEKSGERKEIIIGIEIHPANISDYY
jgi:hypothetical protein